MNQEALFLHLSDLHLNNKSANIEDIKEDIGIGTHVTTPTNLFNNTLNELSLRLKKDGKKLSGIIISGDCKSEDGTGTAQIKSFLLEAFKDLGVVPGNIVVTPGNHDVLKGSPDSSLMRYADFTDAWRSLPCCITPLIDGIDFDGKGKLLDGVVESHHYLFDKQANLLVIPLNSANWSQVKKELPKELAEIWDEIPEKFSDDPDKIALYKQLLTKQITVDAALVSNDQINLVKNIIEKVSSKDVLVVVVMHHHISSFSKVEEHKPYADLLNANILKQRLIDWNVQILIHGHKHNRKTFFDHIYPSDPQELDPHKLLVISGGSVSNHTSDFCQLISISGQPRSPVCTISAVPAIHRGSFLHFDNHNQLDFPLWNPDQLSSDPIIVRGNTVDEVYDRVCWVVDKIKTGRQIICHIEMNGVSQSGFVAPENYPHDLEGRDLNKWFADTVTWWQMQDSKLKKRIPYIHGIKLHNYAGIRNQISRIITLLREKQTTKAVAVLIDPVRDFSELNPDSDIFASFCFVQFKRRQVGEKIVLLDCISYYRAQEFRRWWPINIGEILLLQRHICEEIGCAPGSITTISADSRTTDRDRMPSQASVPIIDQLIDRDPAELVAMVQALVHPGSGDCRVKYLNMWKACLDDLVVEKSHVDGVPVAVEGIEFFIQTLKTSIDFGSPEQQTSISRIISQLELIKSENSNYRSNPTAQTFNKWRISIKKCVDHIKKLSV